MGLLNEAIQEHLELKRLHGADPSEVIREEREVFGSSLRVEDAEPAKRVADFEELATARTGHAVDEAQVYSDPNLSHLSQETVELDMRAVLEAESIESNGGVELDTLPSAMSAAPARAMVEPYASEGDSLEWEMPGERKQDFGGQPREEEFAPANRALHARKAPAGDVLAGRPDSLRAAASQKRMWLDRPSAPDLDFQR